MTVGTIILIAFLSALLLPIAGLLIASRDKAAKKSSTTTEEASTSSIPFAAKAAVAAGVMVLAMVGWFGLEEILKTLYTPESLKAFLFIIGLTMVGSVYWHKKAWVAVVGVILILLAPFFVSMSTNINSIPEKGIGGLTGNSRSESRPVKTTWKGVPENRPYQVPGGDVEVLKFKLKDGYCNAKKGGADIRQRDFPRSNYTLIYGPPGSESQLVEIRTLKIGESWGEFTCR